MTILYLGPPFTIGFVWILTRMKRTLPPTEELISRLHPEELKDLQDFMPHNDKMDILKTDARFWKCTGGYAGLLRKRRNAVCFVQLCQSYVRDSNMDKEDVEYVYGRALLIGFLILWSLPEEAVRLFWKRMPHLGARWIVYLYWEAATQAQMLNIEYGTGRLKL